MGDKLSPVSRLTEIVSLLCNVRSDIQFSDALATILPRLLASLELGAGSLRILSTSSHADIIVDSQSGAARFCFDSLDAPVCACGQALYRDDDLVVSRKLAESACREAGFSTVLACAIRLDGEKEGLFLAGGGEGWTLSNEQEELVRAVCRHIGETALRLRDTKEERQRSTDLQMVYRIGRLITSRLSLKEMVAEIVSRLGVLLETDEVNVTLYDEESRELSFLARYLDGRSDSPGPEVFPLSDGINSWIVRERRSLLMTYDTLEECQKLGIRHGGKPAKSWLGSPMIYKEKVVGVLSVQSYTKVGLYDERSRELLDAVAAQCAVAVENATLFEEVVVREREKERLYFSLTHDLLSLLNPVSGFAKLLKAMPDDAGRSDYTSLADRIIASSEKIGRFVEDLLVWSKIRSGKLTLNIARSDLLLVTRVALFAHTPELLMRRIMVTLNDEPVSLEGAHYSSAEPVMADFDVAQIERVFLNLIGNGVKHARSRIDITVAAHGDTISVCVKDDGVGVPSHLAASLFEEYYQVEQGGSKKGVGLGLPTVKKIVELHHGALMVDSDTGRGFLVEFSWPRTLADRGLNSMAPTAS